MDFYRGKSVYITGGSSGIGLEAAKLCAAAGANVAISARGQERLDAALSTLKALAAVGGGNHCAQKFLAIACDVSDPAASQRAADQVIQTFNGCDVVIANAGVAQSTRVLETEAEVYERMMRINYFGTVHAVRAFLPYMFGKHAGHIGVVSSMLGFMGVYGYTAYAPSKFAQVGFVECLRQECVDFGVSVTLLYPPDTDTPQLVEESRLKPPETKAIAGNVKVMTPEAVAEALLGGIAKKKLHVVPSGMGKFTHFMKRHLPGVVNWVIDSDLEKYRKKHPETRPG